MTENKDTDLLGQPLFIGATVATSVGVGRSSSAIRYGKIVKYDEFRNELKIIGGNCSKALKRRPNQVIVLMILGDKNDT